MRTVITFLTLYYTVLYCIVLYWLSRCTSGKGRWHDGARYFSALFS